MRLNKLWFSGLIATLLLFTGCTNSPNGSFTPVYSTQFNSIDSSWALYQGPGDGKGGPRLTSNITLGKDSDGTTYARLWTRPVNGVWSSGGMMLRMPLQYGQYTIRSRSITYGPGNKYAIMLWPTPDYNWAENDFNESWDSTRHSYMITDHFRGAQGNHGMIHHGVVLDLTQWHTFILRHQPGMDTYYVDGQVIWTNTSEIAKVPMSLAIQTALFGTARSYGVLDVDYVQVWKYS